MAVRSWRSRRRCRSAARPRSSRSRTPMVHSRASPPTRSRAPRYCGSPSPLESAFRFCNGKAEKECTTMALRLGDTAPDFTADTTEGRIKFHDFIGSNWVVLFSHPKDFTPVCTTELGYMARIKPEFDKRGVKIIGLSVDSNDSHQKWSQDIKETQGHAPNYPLVADPERKVADLYD